MPRRLTEVEDGPEPRTRTRQESHRRGGEREGEATASVAKMPSQHFGGLGRVPDVAANERGEAQEPEIVREAFGEHGLRLGAYRRGEGRIVGDAVDHARPARPESLHGPAERQGVRDRDGYEDRSRRMTQDE